MRFLTADYLYPLHINPLKNGVLQISNKGEVISIFEDRKSVPKEKLEVFEGVLCPGFINAHCHLELSHLKGAIEQQKGLLYFISKIKKRNDFTKDSVLYAIEKAEEQMLRHGVVAVGDVCNTVDTLSQKQKGNLKYYSFIEAFCVINSQINQTIRNALDLRNQFRMKGLKATISPHAPYSVSAQMMREIAKKFDSNDELITIHLQESMQENKLFQKKRGKLCAWLKSINASPEIWEDRGRSVEAISDLEGVKALIVHNTFAKKEDITSNYYCTCPKANLYIEGVLPNYTIFNPDLLCVGTDSLASNNSLSVLEELEIIQRNSCFDLNTLLKIASKNGAEALGFKDLGTFEKGKKPGVNLISGLKKVEVIA